MEEKYLKNPRIFYKRHIKSNKPPLVFIHGVWGSSSAWKDYENYFKKKYNIISIDVRGQGKSFRPKKYTDYSIPILTEDVYKIIKNEKCSKVILISNSFSNFITLEFIKKHKNLVKKAILISPHYNLEKIPLTKYTKHLVKILSKFYILFPPKKNLKQLSYERFRGHFTGDWDLKRVVPDIFNTGLRSSLILLSQSYNYNAENFIEKIKTPILIIHGKNDTIFPFNHSKEMSYKMKNCKFISIEKGYHIMVLNNFKELTKAIDEFLNTNKKSKGI